MALFVEIKSAATEAQANLAQLQGMGQEDEGNVTINNFTGPGVFGRPVIVETMMVGGGYKQRHEIPLLLTRTEWPNAPQEKIKALRLFPRREYTIVTVDTHDPIFWRLSLLKVGT